MLRTGLSFFCLCPLAWGCRASTGTDCSGSRNGHGHRLWYHTNPTAQGGESCPAKCVHAPEWHVSKILPHMLRCPGCVWLWRCVWKIAFRLRNWVRNSRCDCEAVPEIRVLIWNWVWNSRFDYETGSETCASIMKLRPTIAFWLWNWAWNSRFDFETGSENRVSINYETPSKWHFNCCETLSEDRVSIMKLCLKFAFQLWNWAWKSRFDSETAFKIAFWLWNCVQKSRFDYETGSENCVIAFQV